MCVCTHLCRPIDTQDSVNICAFGHTGVCVCLCLVRSDPHSRRHPIIMWANAPLDGVMEGRSCHHPGPHSSQLLSRIHSPEMWPLLVLGCLFLEGKLTNQVFSIVGLPWWLRKSSIHLQCRRPGFDPWGGKILWRREWLPTPVVRPGEFHGQRSLVGSSPWGRKESATPERLSLVAL